MVSKCIAQILWSFKRSVIHLKQRIANKYTGSFSQAVLLYTNNQQRCGALGAPILVQCCR